MWIERYFQAHRLRVNDDTAKSLRKHIWWEVFLTVVAALAGWFVEKPLDQIASAIILGFLAIAMIIVGTYVFNLFASPVRIFREKSLAIDQLTTEKEQLIEAAKPRLEIIFDHGKEPFEHIEPLGSSDKAIRLLRIGIHNPSNERLEHCFVQLTKMAPPNAFTPIRLKLHNENPSSVMYLNYNFAQEFSLAPHATEYVDVARFDEKNPYQEIELCYATLGHANGGIARNIGRGSYQLDIDIFAERGNPANTTFRLWIDQDGYLRMQRLS